MLFAGVSGDSEHLYILRSDPGTDLIDVKLTKVCIFLCLVVAEI